MKHIRTRTYHPMTQGKVERYHRSMKNLILLDNYYSPTELEARISEWGDHYNNQRYHEAIDYARRWMFKHPTPADFFRTMEDASGVDLDWFWRGWFFGTDHVDLALDDVRWFKINTQDPKQAKSIERRLANKDRVRYITNIRNTEAVKKTAVEKDQSLRDFYSDNAPLVVITPEEKKAYETYLSSLKDEEKNLLQTGDNYYEISLSNPGGLCMPVILNYEYADGTEEVKRNPVEIWRRHNDRVSKVFVCQKDLRRIVLDPFLETADVDTGNNVMSPPDEPSYFKVRKSDRQTSKNLMQKLKKNRQRSPRHVIKNKRPISRSGSLCVFRILQKAKLLDGFFRDFFVFCKKAL